MKRNRRVRVEKAACLILILFVLVNQNGKYGILQHGTRLTPATKVHDKIWWIMEDVVSQLQVPEGTNYL